MDLELSGKVAVVTGASVGIGLAVCEGLALEGVSLVMVARNGDRLAAEAERIQREMGVDVLPVACDVSDGGQITSLGRAIDERFGGADILFNNAGTGSNETIMEASDEKWLQYWDLHVMAAVRLARVVVPGMRRRGGGVILHNASIAAKQPMWYEPIYNVTKSALVMFSKTLAHELIKDGIRVNTINPGLILTPDWIKTAKELTEGKTQTWQEHLDGVAGEYAPIARFASPKELADFIVFLCSARASYSVGSTYFVDGGMLRTI